MNVVIADASQNIFTLFLIVCILQPQSLHTLRFAFLENIIYNSFHEIFSMLEWEWPAYVMDSPDGPHSQTIWSNSEKEETKIFVSLQEVGTVCKPTDQ